MSTVPGWATLRAHRTSVRTLNVSKTGIHLVSGDDEGFVVLWSLLTRRPLAIWHAHENALLTTEFWMFEPKREEYIVTHARDNKLRIWKNPVVDSVSQSQHYNTSPLPQDPEDISDKYPKPWLVYTQDVNALNFCSVALSTTNIFAATATIASERIDVYALDEHLSVSRPFKALNAADSLPLDTQLENEAAQSKRRGLLGAVMALKFSGDSLIAGYESGHIAKFSMQTGEVEFLVHNHKEPILSLTMCGSRIFVSAADRKISIVDINTGNSQIAAELVHRGVASVDALSITASMESNALLVTAGWDGKVRLFQINDTRNNSSESTDTEPKLEPEPEPIDNVETIEIQSFPGGRQLGVTTAKICAVDPTIVKRRLRPLPPIWIIVAGKDGRIGLHAYHNNNAQVSLSLLH